MFVKLIGYSAFTLFVAIWPSLTIAAPRVVSGPVVVTDGDSLRVANHKIRIHGIDAPEARQTCRDETDTEWDCGAMATAFAKQNFAGKSAECAVQDVDRYGRLVARCEIGGDDVGAAMVANGWAVAYQRYTKAYVSSEQRAKSARLGIHRGTFVPPENWRRGVRLKAKARQGDSSNCLIKGNISSKGARIYHRPGQQHYHQTRISPSKGERYFCTEAEAVAAGWRPARR